MEIPRNGARVVAVERGEPLSPDAVVIGGRRIEVSQNHLVEPFVGLLESVEKIALAASGQDPSNDEGCIRTTYGSLYRFFQALLPSASHPVIDGLTYSVTLLLVGEAIEASRVVVAPPIRAQAAATPEAASGERQRAHGRSGE